MTTALHDPVTGLPTREMLCEHVGIALARAREDDRRVALLHLGLDGFGLVNASLGNEAGDGVLREVAERVRAAIPEQHVVARARGDELCVLVADLDGDAIGTAERLARDALETLRAPFVGPGGTSFELGASAGASVFGADAADGEALLRHADSALRQAKERCRGDVVFYAGGTSEALHRLIIAGKLRSALESQEFFLEYQPIVGLPGGSVAAVEALLRWEDPSRGGRVPPLEFIPHAEASGLIVPIGEWVVDRVCAQAADFGAQGHDVAVSFNVSPRQFHEPGFVQVLEDRMEAHAVDPQKLIVEVTESTVMDGPDAILETLRALGVRIAIDDFGAGHSSLGRLRDLPVDLLKLDRAFLDRMPQDDRAAKLVLATLALAEALGMGTVVEGVETAEQLAFLTEHDADLLQGFHLARPMAGDRLDELLRA